MNDDKIDKETLALALQLRRQKNAGQYLQELRNGFNKTLAQVCGSLTISPNYLSELERGKKVPSDAVIRELANYYHINESELFDRYGIVPLIAREELENNKTLQRTLIEIGQSKKLTDEQKEELYQRLYEIYRENMDKE